MSAFISIAARSGGLLLALASITGCATDDMPDFQDPRIAALIASGSLRIELDGASDDPSVVADARDLIVRTLDHGEGLDLAATHHMSIRYLGKGRVGGEPSSEASRDRGRDDGTPALTGFDAFNPATRNQFRIGLPGAAIESIGISAARRGLDRGSVVAHETAPAFSWSNGDDDRFRMYGLNAAVTNEAHRTLVRLGGGCSGTMVGPRHIVTAGHCLYDRDTDTWSDNFWARAGRNGTFEVAEVFVDNDNIPNGQILWYFTPSQYRSEVGSTWGYDFGILVVPGRIGDTAGWMGRVSISAANLGGYDVFRRGYPGCDVASRTDDPNPCDDHHLYGNTATCSTGEYESLDSSGWSRIVHHSCDASAGDSGSPLYVYFNDMPSVWAVHTTSECETSPTDDDCVGSQINRPLAATRLTPEYRDWISHFRNIYP